MKNYSITYDNPAERSPPKTHDSVGKALIELGGTVSFPPVGPETTIGFKDSSNITRHKEVMSAILSGLDLKKGSAMIAYRDGNALVAFTWPTADTTSARQSSNWGKLL